jgi:serine/threonine protein kinase
MSGARRYAVQEVLGQGGFGTVYRAELAAAGGFRKVVALKVLNEDVEGSEEVARRFRDEARILGLVRHRAIVQVDGLVQLGNRWAVVMEFVDGVSLDVAVRRCPLPVGPALEVVSEVARALDVAWHTTGPEGRPLHLMHRDIKPSNIQLTAAGDVKLLDFGVARAEFGRREAHTRALAFGSVPYMSPERLDFQDTPAGDVYALGAVLFELVAGEAMGKAKGDPGAHEARVARRAGWLRANVPRGGAELAALFSSMVAHDPSRRPTARELERATALLQRTIGGALLRDWAEAHVPRLQAERPQVDHAEFSHSTLIERAGGESLAVSGGRALPTPPPIPRPTPIVRRRRSGGATTPTPDALLARSQVLSRAPRPLRAAPVVPGTSGGAPRPPVPPAADTARAPRAGDPGPAVAPPAGVPIAVWVAGAVAGGLLGLGLLLALGGLLVG